MSSVARSAPTDPNIGRILDQRYEIMALLGKGGMGRVYLGRHSTLGGAIAIKFLSQTLLSPKRRDNFLNEAKTCSQLGQETIHIVHVHDVGLDERGIPFYVMEYLPGQSLSQILGHGPLPLPRFVSILSQICQGLKVAHGGIVVNGQRCPVIHRDIKPSNILVTPDATLGELAKILDFGIAKLIQGETNPEASFEGSFPYAAPEQMEGLEPTPQSDIYSLGIVMFCCLTGKLPIRAASPTFGGWYKAHSQTPPASIREVAPRLQLPQSLTGLIHSCLEKKPEHRPANVTEVLACLKSLDPHWGERQGPSVSLPGEAVARPEPVKPPSIDELCRSQTWPRDKPLAQIVFSQQIETSEGLHPTLWTMLPRAEIQQLALASLYTQVYRNFLCAMAPHPMLMWVTALHSRFFRDGQDARWLPCFLDLKSPHGQRFIRRLAAQGEYRVLFFALEEPGRCSHVLKTTIRADQCSRLGQWAIASQTQLSLGQPIQSKEILRNELKQLKSQNIFALD